MNLGDIRDEKYRIFYANVEDPCGTSEEDFITGFDTCNSLRLPERFAEWLRETCTRYDDGWFYMAPMKIMTDHEAWVWFAECVIML